MPRSARLAKAGNAASALAQTTTPRSVPRSSRTASLRRSVANSSDQEDELSDSLASDSITKPTTSRQNSSSKRILDKVVIAPMHPKGSRSKVAAATSESSAASTISTRDSSVAYETPNTTAMNTPAGELGSFSTSGAKFSLGGSSITESTKRKRGRSLMLKNATTADDEEIARLLQEQEYGGSAGATGRKRGRGRLAMKIEDSEDEGDEKEVKMEDGESSEEEHLSKKSKRTKAKPVRKGRLASRLARTRIATSTPKKGVEDDDDEEEESEFDPGADDYVEHFEDRRGSAISLSSTDTANGVGDTMSRLSVVQNDRRAQLAAQRRARMAEMRVRRFQTGYDRKEARRAKLEKAHPEIKTMWNELKEVPIIEPVEAAQPEAITRRLKPFQLQGLDWMIKQEKSQYKGGLLGDEMGMGKTIQAVSLIMSDFPAKEPTLVLVPPVA